MYIKEYLQTIRKYILPNKLNFLGTMLPFINTHIRHQISHCTNLFINKYFGLFIGDHLKHHKDTHSVVKH